MPVDLDGDCDRFGLVRMAMVVTMLAIRAVNMGCRAWVYSGLSHRMRRVSSARTVATCTVGPGFRLKRFFDGVHDQVHGPQHVGQHMVRLYFQMVRPELDRHMPIAQMVGRAGQVKRCAVRCASRDAQHSLRRSQYPNHGAILCNQHIAATQHGAARQKNSECPAQRVGGFKTDFLPHVPAELQGGGAFDQHRGQTGST